MAEYIFTVCMGVAAGILIFPASLNHIFLGQQGRRAFINAANGFMLFIAVCGYFSVIVQISPKVVDRYQFIIYPFCVLITVAIVVYLLRQLGTEYKSVPGIYVTAGDHLGVNNCLFLAKQDMTYPLCAEQINELPEICKVIDAEQLILYVDIYYDEQQTAESVAELLKYRSYALLYDNTFTQIFVLSR